MYKEIQVISTEEDGKYLFIKDNNLIYGGFIVKDIVELLKEKLSNENIAQILSQKYNSDISTITINEIVNNQLDKLLIDPKKKRSLKKLKKVILDPDITYPNILFSFFKTGIFYFLLTATFIINTFFYFFNDSSTFDLSIFDKIFAYILLFIILIFHEFGHIISAKFYSTDVKEIGIGIYRIIPVLYVNLDEIWKLDRKKRIIVNFAGIYFQSIIGVILIGLLVMSGQNIFGYLFYINYAVLILNLNPFFQFDGYWILTDLIKAKNLNQTSNFFLKNMFKKNDISTIIKIYSILRISLFIYIAFHFIKKIILYVT